MGAIDTTLLPIASVDGVILTIEDGALKVLLHRRPRAPHEGRWALPGGWIHKDEDGDPAASMQRILADKVDLHGLYLEQLQTYGGPGRDPRGWSISIAHLGLCARQSLMIDEGREDIKLFDIKALPECAFDHAEIIHDAVARLRGKGAYSTIPMAFLAPTFILSEIQGVFEIVLDEKLDHSSFRRKILAMDVIEETGDTRKTGQRPAKLYRAKEECRVFSRFLGFA